MALLLVSCSTGDSPNGPASAGTSTCALANDNNLAFNLAYADNILGGCDVVQVYTAEEVAAYEAHLVSLGFVPDELVPDIYARVADSIELMVIVTYANGYISAAISQEESFDDYPPSNPGGNGGGGILLFGEVERVKNLYLLPVITAMFESPYIFSSELISVWEKNYAGELFATYTVKVYHDNMDDLKVLALASLASLGWQQTQFFKGYYQHDGVTYLVTTLLTFKEKKGAVTTYDWKFILKDI